MKAFFPQYKRIFFLPLTGIIRKYQSESMIKSCSLKLFSRFRFHYFYFYLYQYIKIDKKQLKRWILFVCSNHFKIINFQFYSIYFFQLYLILFSYFSLSYGSCPKAFISLLLLILANSWSWPTKKSVSVFCFSLTKGFFKMLQ